MFRFVHAADLHLDSPLRGLETYSDAPVEQIRCAARRAFDNLVSLAVEEQAAFVLLSGDIFDGDWKDYNSGLYFMNRLGRLREAGIAVFMVAGNHDAASQLSKALQLPDNVHRFPHARPGCVVREDLGVAVHGQSFAGRSVTEDLSREYAPAVPGLCNIGLLHTSLTGRAGHESYAPCSLEGLAGKGYDYWALGHVHQREIVSRVPWVVFPGNIQGRHIRETGPRGCALVSVEDGRIGSVEFRDVDVLRFGVCRVDVGGCSTPESVLDKARQSLEAERRDAAGRPLAARVVFEGRSVMHSRLHRDQRHLRNELRALAADLGDVWLEKMLVATRPESARSGEADSPLAGLMQAVGDIRLDGALLELVPEFEGLHSRLPAELLAAGDPFHPGGEELETLCREVGDLLLSRLQEASHED